MLPLACTLPAVSGESCSFPTEWTVQAGWGRGGSFSPVTLWWGRLSQGAVGGWAEVQIVHSGLREWGLYYWTSPLSIRWGLNGPPPYASPLTCLMVAQTTGLGPEESTEGLVSVSDSQTSDHLTFKTGTVLDVLEIRVRSGRVKSSFKYPRDPTRAASFHNF